MNDGHYLYKNKIISTIVDTELSAKCTAKLYKNKIISTIVDIAFPIDSGLLYKNKIISTIVDEGDTITVYGNFIRTK